MMERKIIKCKLCDHIHYEDEPHECPSEEYIARRNRLISDAAEYEETLEPHERELL